MVTTHPPITLNDLPAPPEGKTGWPWTEAGEPLPQRMPDGSRWPRISIVTPSYNQGRFLEETLRSVLLQGYPNVEYLILDGGSTDDSVEIIQKYAPFITYWVSEPDGGQAIAINKGFKLATGELIGWQNSDDVYGPNAFWYAAECTAANPQVDVVYGSLDCITSDGCFYRQGYVSDFNVLEMLPWANMFNQSMFFRRRIFDQGYFIDESFQHYMDLEFFWRLALANYQFQFEPRIGAKFRLHEDAKGFTQYDIATYEGIQIYASIYQNPTVPELVKQKALDCIQNQCIDCFGKSKFSLFRSSLLKLLALKPLVVMHPGLLSRYLLSFGGQKPVLFLRQTYHQIKSGFSIRGSRP